MIQLFLTDFFIYLFLVFGGGSEAPADNNVPQEMACTECHTDLVENDVMHYPAEDACDNCHESTGNEHPGDSLGFALMDQIPALCFYCHEEGAEIDHPHQPVSEGKCLDCHDAHGSSNAMVLKSPEQELCLSCHNKSYESDSSLTINIGRLVKGKMIPHSAIEGGGCLVCHRSHGSENQNFLVVLYPVDDYISVSTEGFGLCFQCHDTDLLEAEETEWGTNFRNGNQNLHWLHINGNKGRNCRMCHNLHGSEQKFLMEEQVAFGDWEMKMNFIPEEQGGSCLSGCHSKLSYSRQ
ncbi:MAG: cytochrome c3 family protein [Bacteroides sp.]|nr:cytochrome c3 family protein [Bacteroides sp.]